MNKIKSLLTLGFTKTEARIYVALASLSVASVKEIAKQAKLPTNKVYRPLESLENKNYVSLLPISPKKYKLVNTKSNLKEILNKKKQELEEINQDIDELILQSQKKQSSFQESFLILQGQKQIMKKLIEETFNAKKEILSCQSSWHIYKNSLNSVKKALDKNVEIKMLGVVNKESKKRMHIWKNLGLKVRKLNKNLINNPLRFTIFDEEKVRITIAFPEINDKQKYLTFWIESISFARLMKRTFYDLWDKSKDI